MILSTDQVVVGNMDLEELSSPEHVSTITALSIEIGLEALMAPQSDLMSFWSLFSVIINTKGHPISYEYVH